MIRLRKKRERHQGDREGSENRAKASAKLVTPTTRNTKKKKKKTCDVEEFAVQK